MADRYEIKVPALEVRQGERRIYCFAVDGKRLLDFTAVSRVKRTDEGSLDGYQRPEVMSHIRAIRRYIESPEAMLPNAVVLAFDPRVRFVPARRKSPVDYSVMGELVIPVDESLPESEKPALLVDGQQRTAAIRDADVAEFPVAAVAFIASGSEEQRSQFILVNNTKPLPKGLIHELLPDATGHLPPKYARRQLPAQVMVRLNLDTDSPFRGAIATPTSPDGYIKDNSVLKMIENSLYDGALYQYRDPEDGSGDIEEMVLHLKIFWNLVEATWPIEWKLIPRKSRLTHGVGIQSLGYVMDAITEGYSTDTLPDIGIDRRLSALCEVTSWTSGTWELAPDDHRRWNTLQNTPNDIKLLTNLLTCVALK
ncbi:DGQHR domain-containing protein DpdB [Mycolicibacterium arenosum]|uniref:DGQHR domain-containing protein n=1 Tax=Mycolicibacterium arenosum TaxID=2952157 RepID=A0ABT1M5C6_9MYCO|nr:DGQHR domain-containing protein DpdB [Mycolicibacterium sp. CAU 1645]MCP9274070.1 DGQHR domain-containing protein [Mycolicibacterium sp. CAU 1645]